MLGFRIKSALLAGSGEEMEWNVYLSGEIHTDWREKIEQGAKAANLPVSFSSAVTHHESSDATMH